MVLRSFQLDAELRILVLRCRLDDWNGAIDYEDIKCAARKAEQEPAGRPDRGQHRSPVILAWTPLARISKSKCADRNAPIGRYQSRKTVVSKQGTRARSTRTLLR